MIKVPSPHDSVRPFPILDSVVGVAKHQYLGENCRPEHTSIFHGSSNSSLADGQGCTSRSAPGSLSWELVTSKWPTSTKMC